MFLSMTKKSAIAIIAVIAFLIAFAPSSVWAETGKSKIYIGIRWQEAANGVIITAVEPSPRQRPQD